MRHWVGTVSREHGRIAVAGGFAMINRGKLSPLQRLAPGDGLVGYRRDIDWIPATETFIELLSEGLEFTRGNWGMLACRGLFEITGADFQTIRAAMTKD